MLVLIGKNMETMGLLFFFLQKQTTCSTKFILRVDVCKKRLAVAGASARGTRLIDGLEHVFDRLGP